MTFSGTADNVFTLAHELGHASRQCPQGYAALEPALCHGVAETASTSELVVADAAIRTAQSKDERLALLDNKIGQAAAMFMNIYARFLLKPAFTNGERRGWSVRQSSTS